ncbi:D-glycerate dehydrogenase [Candidatus Curtissbacteria bacterium]|nr:D-glycerate dehydrogenase [Candidatus Curtissbacteria bacterium]
MPSVYVTAEIPQNGITILTKRGFKVQSNLGRRLSKNELKEIFAKYDGVVTLLTDHIDEEIIKSSRNLKIIANFAVGFDNIDVLAAKKHGVVVTNTPSVANISVAEHTMMLILACQKRLIGADRYVRAGRLERWDPLMFLSPQVWGKTIGIVGLGGIGLTVGQMALQGFKMKIFYNDIIRAQDFEMISGAKFVDLETLLSSSDIVTLHVPLTVKTHHMIDKKEFSLMKKTAIFVNTSRGSIVNQEALIWALTNGIIAGAGLDVFENEPHVPHTLSVLGNVILTPHIGSATFETREAMAKIVAENIIDVFEGRTPLGLVKVD